MSVNSCKDCKRWGSEPYPYWDGEGFDHEAAHRKCGLVTLGGSWPESGPDPTIPFLMDGSGYKADLWTPPTWSCPQFEAKALPPQEAP